MPFIRHNRDKRGFDHTYVMHAYRNAQGNQRGRVLYLFRSPAGLKIGRQPLDNEVREALEHTHPDLTFDWIALGREAGALRSEERDRERDWSRDRGRDRDRDRARSARPPSREPAPVEAAPAAPAPVPVEDDQSLLGRTTGAAAAGRLRARYGELVQRVTRRARSLEERDRLLEQAARLNPDSWTDEAAIQTMAAAFEADLAALTAVLPQRRRGRRGGRDRHTGRPGAPESGAGTETSPEGGASAIIDPRGEFNGRVEDDVVDAAPGGTDDAGYSRDRGTGNAAADAGRATTGFSDDDEPDPAGREGS